MRCIKFLSCLALFAGLAACNNSDSDSEPNTGDREAMLRNIGQNVILPNYQAFSQKAQNLKQATQAFRDQVNKENLEAVRSDFKATYKAWQRVKPYNFGPAQQAALRLNLNTFPVDTQAVEQRVSESNLEWGPYDNDTKGLPTLDYLLYQPQNPDKAIALYKGSEGRKRLSYLKAVVANVASKAQKVYQRWKPAGGDHLSTFQNATGNDKGSSLGLIVNQLNFDFETIKDEKLGIPAGKKSMGNTFPKKVEAYYSGMSIPLMKANLQAIENLFLGRHGEANGPGLDDRLDATNAERDGQALSEVITSQFNKIDQTINNIPRPLPAAIKQDHPKIDEAFTAIKRQVVFLKTDMPAALGVRITYQDNDGD